MKAYRNLIIIILVILVLGVGLYAVTKFEPKSEDVVQTELPATVTIYETEKDSIASLYIVNPEESYTLVKKSGVWCVLEDASVVLDQSRVESLLYECANIAGQKLVNENAEDLSQYGLDNPTRTVTIKLHDGTSVKVLIGSAAFENSVSYLMVEGETKVYTKSTSGCNTLTGTLSALLDTDIYMMDPEDIGGITIRRNGGETIVLEREKVQTEGGEDTFVWTMRSPISKEANTSRLQEELLPNLLSQKAVNVIAIPEAGFDYGFANPRAEYTIVSLDKNESYTIIVGKTEGTNTYISKKGDKSIYLVETDKLDFLQLNYNDLIDKLIHVENLKDVSEVQLSGLGKAYTMTISPDDKTYAINGKEIEEDAFRKVYQAVIGFTLDDFAKSGGKDAAFTITYKKTDGSQSVVKCLNYDDRNYLVTVNGSGNLLIRKKQVDNMIATIESALVQ